MQFDIEICGISAIEIKMFAVNEKYQDLFFEYTEGNIIDIKDLFFEYDGESLPVSAWVMQSIIDYAQTLMDEVVGFKALFLHSVPEAEKFYKINGFNPMEINMQPLHCVDSDYTAMYLALKEVQMNYDD